MVVITFALYINTVRRADMIINERQELELEFGSNTNGSNE